MPCVRVLVKAFSYPLAAPHVYTGIESILPLMARMSAAAAETPSKRARRAGNESKAPIAAVAETKVFALVVVVFLYVVARMMNQDITPEEYEARRDKAIRTLLEVPAAKNITFDELSPEAEDLMNVSQQEGWLQMEWFLNIAPVQNTDEMEGIEMADDGTARSVAGKSLGLKDGSSDYIGLGTMLQDANDYLGERHRQEYKSWKAKIMARVEEIEAGA